MAYDKNGWNHWIDNLDGKDVPVHPSQPMRGFYARRVSDKEAPQAIAFDWDGPGDSLRCWVNGAPVAYGLDVWLSCARKPISHEVYIAVVKRGEPWPAEIRFEAADGTVQSTQIGSNSGGDEDATLKGNIQEWIDRAKAAQKAGAPKTSDEADTLSDLATKLVELAGEADKRRLARTKSLRDQTEEINTEWFKVARPASAIAGELKALVGIWQQAERKRRQEEADKAAAEAAAKGQPAATVAPPAPVMSGTRGKRVAAVKRKVVVISDLPKVAAFLASMEKPPVDFVDAVKAAAYRLLNASITVDGATLETQESIR